MLTRGTFSRCTNLARTMNNLIFYDNWPVDTHTGADVHVQDTNGDTPLHLAIGGKLEPDHKVSSFNSFSRISVTDDRSTQNIQHVF